MTNIEIKEARVALGLSMPKMASLIGTKLRTYEDWEYGKTNVPGQVERLLFLLFKYKGAVKYLLAKYT